MLENKFETSFKNYVDFISQNLMAQGEKTQPESLEPIFQLVANLKLKEKVDQFVGTPQFSELVKNIKSVFSESEVREIRDVVQISYFQYFHTEFIEHEWWVYAVNNFFCRSGFYQKILNAIDFNIHDLFEQFCLAFRKKEFKTIYIAPLEEVDFSGPNMNLNGLQIRKFTADELEEIFNNKINGIFYPEACFDNTILLHYWFLVVEDIETPSNITYEFSKYPFKGFVSHKYTNFPSKIEASLRPLLLCEWRLFPLPADTDLKADRIRNDTPHELDKFKIPFVLKNDDNLLAFPEKNKLIVELYGHEYITPYGRPLSYGEEETKRLKEFLIKVKVLLDDLELDSDKLKYLNIAFGFMTKAFFCERLEELAFNLIALEALFGKKEEEMRKKLGNRLSIILGDSSETKEKIRKGFDELYSFRCQLLHGRKFGGKVYEDHLREARELIRKVLLWYLFYLTHSKNRKKEIPSRYKIIELIESEDNSVSTIRRLLKSFMEEFS